MTHNVARVEIWGQPVGALSYDKGTGLCAFQYDPSWVRTAIELSPVKLPLSDRICQFPTLSRETYRGLPGAFADSLPDDFGNALVDAWLARAGRDKDSFSGLERLLYTGRRGMGAFEYFPSIDTGLESPEIVEMESLIDMAQSVLNHRAELSEILTSDKSSEALYALFQVGTSAGGARPKAVIGINKARTEIRSGQVDLPEGFEHYLLKFDGVTESFRPKKKLGEPRGFGRMEYAYYRMAKDAGINMSDCELLIDGTRSHFVTRRFDRIGNKRVHYQSLCAMDHADYNLPGHYSYEELFSLMRSLRLNRAQALELYRRMVFNIVARNHDDHTKNFGFILNEKHRWELSPAFDIAYSYKPGSKWLDSHQMSLNGKRDDFTREDLLAPAGKFRKEAEKIIDEVTEIVSQWPKYAKGAGVLPDFARQIQRTHRLSF